VDELSGQVLPAQIAVTWMDRAVHRFQGDPPPRVIGSPLPLEELCEVHHVPLVWKESRINYGQLGRSRPSRKLGQRWRVVHGKSASMSWTQAVFTIGDFLTIQPAWPQTRAKLSGYSAKTLWSLLSASSFSSCWANGKPALEICVGWSPGPSAHSFAALACEPVLF